MYRYQSMSGYESISSKELKVYFLKYLRDKGLTLDEYAVASGQPAAILRAIMSGEMFPTQQLVTDMGLYKSEERYKDVQKRE